VRGPIWAGGFNRRVLSWKIDVYTVRICGACLIGIVLIAILAGDLLGGTAPSAARSSGSAEGAVVLTEYELLSRAYTIEPRPYWIGPRPGIDRFELEQDSDGNVYVRYLTGGDTAGNRRSDSLTVAGYPLAEAQQSLERAARAAVGGEKLLRHDGFAVLGSGDSQSAYVVFDDQPELQIEIYSPRPGEAAELAVSGALTPVYWTPLG
jgi:hypothetical protein